MESPGDKIALFYLVRGRDDNFMRSLDRFVASYAGHAAGAAHTFYTVFKGFDSAAALEQARRALSGVPHIETSVADDSFDLGAYAAAARQVEASKLGFLNTGSEILCDDWLAKLAIAHDQEGVGLVGATGSFESLQGDKPPFASFPAFPNPHLRSNAFMIHRGLFLEMTENAEFRDKSDAYLFESGPQGMTRRILARGAQVLIVGRNGRGYPPRWWPLSDTFRQGTQGNLLVADNQTRAFAAMKWTEKRQASLRTWGDHIREDAPPLRM